MATFYFDSKKSLNPQDTNSSIGTLQIAELETLIKQLKDDIYIAPEGTIHTHQGSQRNYYYHVSSVGTRQYLSPENTELITSLAQKRYNQQLLKIAIQNQRYLEKRFPIEPPSLESAFEKIPDALKPFIQTNYLPANEFAKRWFSEPYTGLPFEEEQSEYVNQNGQSMRSKSEYIISNILIQLGLPYKYEKPLTIGRTTFYPDFTILDINQKVEVYYEHFGLMSNSEYATKALRKIATYEQAGFFMGDRFLCSFESDNLWFNPSDIRSKLEWRFSSSLL